MRKRLIGLSALTAALAFSASFSAFAAGWVQDSHGWSYVRDNGTYVSGQAFTDPEDGAMYYFDPDGYMMTETRVEGFWYGADGKRRDKTEEELRAEQERAAREAAKPSPSKARTAANEAAKTARTSGVALSTNRFTFQTEMKSLMDEIFIDARKQLEVLDGKSTRGSITEDNIETTYRFPADARGVIISSSLWKMNSPESAGYVPYVLEMDYKPLLATNEGEQTLFNDSFQKLLVAGLGETQGKQVFAQIQEQVAQNAANFKLSGNTDTFNTFELTVRNGAVNVRVTCSEIEPVDPEATDAAAETTDAAATEAASQPASSSVITAGQGQATEDTAADTAADTTAEAAEGTDGTAEDTAADATAETTADGTATEATDTAADTTTDAGAAA